MSALHLLWIIPLAASFGFMICAVLTVGKRGESEKEDKHHERTEIP